MQKEEKFKGVIDEFRYLIETNEKHNHELLEDLTWMRKTANSYKHEAQKSYIDKQDIKLRDFKIKELKCEINKKRIMNKSVNLSALNSFATSPRSDYTGKPNKFANIMRASKRAE